MEGHLIEALTLPVRKPGSGQVGTRAVRSRSGRERQPRSWDPGIPFLLFRWPVQPNTQLAWVPGRVIHSLPL